jgi:putative nucleotidyltransferase with HDIG domain
MPRRKPRSPAAPRYPRGGGRRARLAKRAVEAWQRLLATPSLWLALFLALGAWALLPGGLLFVPQLEVGAIADRDYVAPENLLVPDEETTLARQQRAREEVPPVYDLDTEPGVEPGIATLFAAGRDMLAQGGAGRRSGSERWVAERARDLAAQSGLRLSPEQAGLLFRKGLPQELEERLRGLAARVARRGVVLSKDSLLEHRLRGITLRHLPKGDERPSLDLYDYLSYPDEVRDLAEAEVRDWPGLSIAERRLLVAFLEANLSPNLHFNKGESVKRQEEAALATPPSFTQVRRGRVIARKGDELDASAVRLINAYRKTSIPLRARLLPIAGTLLLLGLASLVVWFALAGEKVAHHSRQRLFGESLLLLLTSLLGANLAFVVASALAAAFETPPLTSARSWAFGVPFAALGLLAALLFGRQTAVVLAAIFSLLASRFAGDAGLPVVVFSLAGSLAAIYSLDRYQVKQRLVMTRVGLVVGAVNVIIVLMLLALDGGLGTNWIEAGFALLCALAGGLLVAAVVSFAVPILEATFGITTDIKLAELANTNLPLLRRLAFEAPGSFLHSLMVANLAKQGCEAIGADAPLAYTAGLYHDVGKVFRPEYFIENQRPGANPHDKLQPSMSALVLISHVKDGLELARLHHLPQPILDAIEQHHGTRLIKYFYSRAAEQQARLGAEVSEEKFRYPGPKPENRVMGVLMLADAVEAASRTLVDPGAAKLRTLIRTIVEDCLHDGQLDDTDLTLQDVKRVADTFLRVLSNIYHQRIDYPGFDFNAAPTERREGRLAVVVGARAS